MTTETERKPRQRRNGRQQAEDIEKALRRARTTFIQEGDEVLAETMRLMEKDMANTLAGKPQEAD